MEADMPREMKMVERVARVLAFDHHRTEENWEEWIEAARAVLEEMRKPTEEMLVKGDYALHTAVEGSGWNEPSAQKIWPAMIDVALEAGK
jgi:hypothetical protein